MLVADAHVHVHACHPEHGLLDDAWANLARVARGHGADAFDGVLCLTETAGDDCFGRFSRLAEGGGRFGAWRFERTGEPDALRACAGGADGAAERVLFVVAGRQVAAREDLEVLAIGTRERFPDGRPIRDALAWARRVGALPVIPWGPGKWLFARAALLRALIEEAGADELYLGDESSRPVFWPLPRPFRRAQARGIRNLPGTDPLPFPRHRARAGAYGFWADAAIDPARPASDLKRLVRDAAIALHPYGAREGPVGFVRNQVAMQLRKRRRGAPPAAG